MGDEYQVPMSWLQLWDVATAKPIGKPMREHCTRLNTLVFSPDSKLIAAASVWNDAMLNLWDVSTQRMVASWGVGLDHDMEPVARFSPDGNQLAWNCGYRHLCLWRVGRSKRIVKRSGHAGYIISLAFSPDSRTLVSTDGRQLGVIGNGCGFPLEPKGKPVIERGGPHWTGRSLRPRDSLWGDRWSIHPDSPDGGPSSGGLAWGAHMMVGTTCSLDLDVCRQFWSDACCAD